MQLADHDTEYWKGSQVELPSQPEPQFQLPKSSTTQRSTPRNGEQRATLNSGSEAGEQPVVARSTKGKDRASSIKPPSIQKSTATRSTRGKATSQRQPLFIADSDEEEEYADKADDFQMGSDDEDEALFDEGDDEEFEATLKSLKSTGRSIRTATQTSSKGKSSPGTAATKKKAPAVVVDDDSDDGGFTAFGARSRTRRR